MKFRIKQSELTFGEIMDLEEGNMRAFHDLLVRFAYSDEGVKLAPDVASKHIRSWTMDELTQRADEIKGALSGEQLPFETASN